MFRSLQFCYKRKQSCYMSNFSQMLQDFFSKYGIHNLQRPSQRTKATNAVVSAVVSAVVHCITVWQIRRWDKQDHSWLQSLAHDRLNVVSALFYHPGTWFRLDLQEITLGLVAGLCLPKKPKAFFQQGSHKKILTRYDIVLQSLTHRSTLLLVVSVVM